MTPKYKVGDYLINIYSGTIILVNKVSLQTTEIWYYFDDKKTSAVAYEEKILRKLTKLERFLYGL